MKVQLTIGLQLLLILGSTTMAQTTTVDDGHAVEITSFPDGANVTLDGVLQKDSQGNPLVTPMELHKIPPGLHQISVSSPSPGWQTDQRTINVLDADPTTGRVRDTHLSFTLMPTLTQGPPGPAGAAATIQIGTVLPGAAPSVTNTGSAQQAILNFVLPQGPAGMPGLNGAAGAISIGAVTATQVSSISPANVMVTNSGNSNAAILNFAFQIPQGQMGTTGATGAAGASSTVPGPQGPIGPPGPSSFAGVWTPSGTYHQGDIVIRSVCTPAMWATPPSCNQGSPGPYINMTGLFLTDPIAGDPIADNVENTTSGNWERIGSAPAGFIPAQVFNTAISVTLSNPAVLVNAANALPLSACFPFSGPADNSCLAGGNTGGFGLSPASGTYHTLTATLASAFNGGPFNAALCHGTCTVSDPLVVGVVTANGGIATALFVCTIPVNGTQCTSPPSGETAGVTLTTGSVLGIEIHTDSNLIPTGSSTIFNIPNITITLTP